MFEIGERLVHPAHGAGTVEKIAFMEISAGVRKRFLVLELTSNKARVLVPLDAVETVGLRKVSKQDKVDKVLELLADPHMVYDLTWKKRYKIHADKLHSGNIEMVAEVLRDLTRKKAREGLSSSETRLLEKARSIVVSEIEFARNLDRPAADTLLDLSLRRRR